MNTIVQAASLAILLSAPPVERHDKKLLATFILEGSGFDARAVDPSGTVRRTIEDETVSAFPSQRARMMTREESSEAVRLHPAEFKKASNAREGAEVLGAPLLFSLSMKRAARSRVLLAFGRTADSISLAQVELLGGSADELLKDWANKKAGFFGSVQKAVETLSGASPAKSDGQR